jgi:hypothetical protein
VPFLLADSKTSYLLTAFPRSAYFFGGDFAVFVGVNQIEAL